MSAFGPKPSRPIRLGRVAQFAPLDMTAADRPPPSIFPGTKMGWIVPKREALQHNPPRLDVSCRPNACPVE